MSATIGEVALGIVTAVLVFRVALEIIPELIRRLARDMRRLDGYDDEALEEER